MGVQQALFDLPPGPPPAWAIIEGPYRYELGRRWGQGRRAVWLMLNPSTADAYDDDATIRRVVGFSKAFGFAEAVVVNLYALRSSSPKALRRHRDPVGPRNIDYIRDAALRPPGEATVICAWGGDPAAHVGGRATIIALDLLLRGAEKLYCLGTTRSGDPLHPVRLSGSCQLQPWEPRIAA